KKTVNLMIQAGQQNYSANPFPGEEKLPGSRGGLVRQGRRQPSRRGPGKKEALAEMALSPAAPFAGEVIIKSAADGSARVREDPPRPLFGHFGAHPHGYALDDAGNQALHRLLFEEVPAKVQTGSAGRGQPKNGLLLFGGVLEAVKQA